MKGLKFNFYRQDFTGQKPKHIVYVIRQVLLKLCALLIPLFLLVAVGLVVYDFGFKPFWAGSYTLSLWLQRILYVLCLLLGVRWLLELSVARKRMTRILTFLGLLLFLFLTFYILPQKRSLQNFDTNRFLVYKLVLYAGIAFAFITEFSYHLQVIYRRNINPALLFVNSFALLIIAGTFLLSVPNATVAKMGVVDLLFTATSAVCVTGLVVVDTATQFTQFGQLIILVLIQIGALGIMSFAGLLAYAVAGQSSLKSQLALRDMMSRNQVTNVVRFIYQVIIVTFFFEAIGAISIYLTLNDSNVYERKLDKVFFSVFHSVSAFCNAGFSTFSNGLYEREVRFNYSLQFFVSLLIILGGMGFPIVFNLYRYLKIKFNNLTCSLRGSPRKEHLPKVINLNSRLALVVSGVLLIIGFTAYLLFEQSHTLAQHPTWYGKLMTSFFGSVTPRTAGFNTVDVTALSLPTIMIYLLLMWIGASPGSTGGGIKTTTAGVAILNMVSVLRGKDRTEFFRSEISHKSVRSSFAIMMLSLLFIGVSVFLISVNDSDKGLIKIAFESFSAFSTVGLSLGITPVLSKMSKIILIVTMFVGRVGTVTLLVAFIRQSKQLYYRYPREDITF
ncbi:MAG TPA: potassium transporter TrkG [Chitinophagaceae bacterium]|nr:potassium transporter TrkG [Chitinophagaceae bacterium]